MSKVTVQGGIYLDTDAFAIQSLDCLRDVHSFVMSFDNIVNEDIHGKLAIAAMFILVSSNSVGVH